MRKIEEFNKTQMLMEEFEKITNKGPEIDGQIEELNSRTNLTIERLEDEMKENMEDIEFNLDRESVEKEYQKRINEAKKEQKSELAKLNKEKEENSDDKKYFRTDENIKTITMEIKEMKEEIRREEIDWKKKELELQEFYGEEQHENPLRWQELHKEMDVIRNNIKELSAKVEEYSNFLNELKSIELTPEEYRKMYERENEKNETERTEPEGTELESVEPVKIEMSESETIETIEPIEPEEIELEQTETEIIEPEEIKSEQTEPKKVEPTIYESIKDEPVKPEPTIYESIKDEPVKPEPTIYESIKDEPVKPESTIYESIKDEPVKPEPTIYESIKDELMKPDLKDIKIIIGKKGLTVKAPGLNKEEGLDELTLNLRSLKIESTDWKEFHNVENFLARDLNEEQFEKLDDNILAALYIIDCSDIDKKIKREIISRYGEAIVKDGKVSEDKSLKGIIEYDRTGLDYLKPSNLISRIIHKKQFDKMKYGADIAEELGIAEIKQDEPGIIRKFLSNMKNKIPLFANKETKLLEDGKKSKEANNRKQTKGEKALLEAMEKYRDGEIDYQGKVATGSYKKMDEFKKGLKYLTLVTNERLTKYFDKEEERKNANKERTNAFSTHVTISDGDVQTKENDEEER